MVHRSGAAARSPGLLTLGVAALLLTAPALVSTAAAQDVGTVSGRVVDDRGVGDLGRASISGPTSHQRRHRHRRQLRPSAGTGRHPDRARADAGVPARLGQRDRRSGRHRDPGLHPAAAIRCSCRTMVVTGTQSPRHESRRQRRRHHAHRAGGAAGGAAEHDRDAALRARLHPGRELGRRSQPEHLDARHSGRRVRDVHGGRAAGLPHDAHLLHERRQPVPLRRRTSSGWRSCAAALAALRVQHAGRDRQLHQQDRRRRVRRHDARHRRPPRASPATTSTPTGRWATTGGSTWAASTATTTAFATPGSPASVAARLKANVTRLLDNGYIRALGQVHRRPQPVHPPPPVHQPRRSAVRPGLQRLRLDEHERGPRSRVPTPDGTLHLPLDNGLRTERTWFTVDVALRPDRATGTCRTPRRSCRTTRNGTRLPSNSSCTAQDFITATTGQGGLGFPAGTTAQLLLTNHVRRRRAIRLPFDTPNGLVALAGEWHVEKPISAVQDQLQLRRTVRPAHPRRSGAYFAQLHPGQSLVLHRHPDRRARQPPLPRPGGHAAGRRARSTSPRTDSGTSSPTTPTARVRPRSCRACWAARSSSPTGSAPTWAAGSSTTTTCRARRTPSTVRPGRRSGHARSTTSTFGNNSFRHFNRRHHRLVGLAGTQLPAQRRLRRVRGRRPRLQDARAGRVPERARARRRWTSSNPARCSPSKAA